MNSHYEMTPYDPSRQTDFWSDVPAAVPAGPGAPLTRGGGTGKPVNPLDRVRRLLRGRTTLAIVLAVVGAMIGASLGWASEQQEYQAYGFVRVDPTVPVITGNEEALPAYRQFMYSEVKHLETEYMATRAMEQPVWNEVVGEPWSPGAFVFCTEAKYSNEDSYLHMFFRHPKPEIAEAGATALVAAYVEYFNERKADVAQQTVAALDEKVKQTKAEIERLRSEASQISVRYGGIPDLAPRLDKLESLQGLYRQDLGQIEKNLALAHRTRESALTTAPLSINQLAMGDAELAQRLADLEALRQRRSTLVMRDVGPTHREMVQLNRQIQMADLEIEQLAEQVRANYFGEIPNIEGMGTIPLTRTYISGLELQRANREADLAAIDTELENVARDARVLEDLRAQEGVRNSELIVFEQKRDQELANSQFQAALGTIKPVPPSPGSAGISKDKRNVMALGGALLGFGIPVGLLVILGLLDSRFRYSEDAAETGDRATLLGILPNLPDRLSDPNQASIAAHCVHQIRTILQINHGSDESRAFAVTSASRGDGKTSLALALGLSYAASGARTLLIDTDLQHGGLSSRLGVTGDEGIMDALTGGDLLQFVCETDVTDLAILPIGRAAGNHAGAFSPGAVRHMLDQAKRHFDVIICDTGPILGSIEATPIASAVDGVVLAVSRGQSRPLVSKALGHLESVGAIVAGLVFNRAQAADFERSVSGMNLRNGSSRLPGRSRNGNGLPHGSVLSQN